MIQRVADRIRAARRFVGRQAELELVAAALAAETPAFAVLYLHGPGGIGKTSLLVESGELRPAQACREYQIAESVLNRWRHEVRLRGAEAAFTPRTGSSATPDYETRIAELERVCGQLAVENAALKNALQRLQSKPGISS